MYIAEKWFIAWKRQKKWEWKVKASKELLYATYKLRKALMETRNPFVARREVGNIPAHIVEEGQKEHYWH